MEEKFIFTRLRDLLPGDMFSAYGHDGQKIHVLPTEDLVVVRTGKYIKPQGEPVAPKGLFAAGLFSDGLSVTGSTPPKIGWSNVEFLGPILDSIKDSD